jgi:hypothetical protein
VCMAYHSASLVLMMSMTFCSQSVKALIVSEQPRYRRYRLT